MSTIISRRETLLVGLVRLLNSHGLLATLETEINQTLRGGKVDVKLDKNQLEVTGAKDDVQAALQYFKTSFSKKVAYDKVEVYASDLNCDQFKSASNTDLISDLEQKHKCVIEVRTKGPKTFDEVLTSKSRGSGSSGRSEITVVEGSLTEFQADALVNTICTNSSDLSQCGQLSKAFLAAAGTELAQAYSAAGVPLQFGSDITVTDAPGTLMAKNVYHVAMRRYRNPESYQLLYDLICTCLSRAVADRLTSVAFPTIGCGNFGYRTKDVVECFLTAAETVSGVQIYVVAFENSIYEIFKENCSSTAETTVIFHINAMTTEAVVKARDELKSRAMDLNVSVPIDSDVIGQLSAQAVADIKKLQSQDVQISIDGPKNRITLTAHSGDKLDQSMRTVKRILKVEKRRITDPQYIKAKQGTSAYLRAIASQTIAYPSHWTTHAKQLSDKKKSVWSCGDGTMVQLGQSESVYAEIQKLVTGTWTPGVIGLGNDAVGLHHSSVSVRKVWRVENPKMYHKYSLKMKELCQSAASKPFPNVKNLDSDEVKTRALNLKTLESVLVPEINEYYLLHGTKADRRHVIAKQGLDTRLSASVYFGNGMYFAESSTKADQYADDPRKRTAVGQPLYMYVVRVMLGHPHVARAPRAFKRPPCVHPSCNSDLCTAQHDFHDSVLGTHRPDGTRLLFREFIVYHPEQSYPEYLVEYVRQ